MIIVYKPEEFENPESDFEGTITFRMLSNTQRIKLIAKLQTQHQISTEDLKNNIDSEIKALEENESLSDKKKNDLLKKLKTEKMNSVIKNAEVMADLTDILKQYCESVDIKKKSNGKVYKSFDDLDMEYELLSVMFSSITFYLNKINLGNVK